MKRTKLFAYEDKRTVIHKLSGFTKLVCFLLLTFAAMLTYDIRVLLILLLFSFVLSAIAKMSFKPYRLIFLYIFFIMIFNAILTFIFDPTFGVKVFGTEHIIYTFSAKYVLTLEQLFYQICKLIKFICILPLGVLFFATIDPSEFASSLNGVKVPYKACTVFSLALRYIPDIQRDFTDISLAQQARGIDTSHKAKLSKRISSFAKILIPLVFSTLDRVELITEAMELRGYGKSRTRTWYSYRNLVRRDYNAILICCLILAAVLVMRFAVVGSLYWNPFI